MVFIKGGTFDMGYDYGEEDERPRHQVTVSDFYLAKYQVTVSEFKKFIGGSRYQTNADIKKGSFYWDGLDWQFKAGVNWKHAADGKEVEDLSEYHHPVVHVSWYDAIYYCNWLSKKHDLEPVYEIDSSMVIANWEANGYRLPTEAEWEYAARSGGEDEKYAGTSVDSLVFMYGNYWEPDPAEATVMDDFSYTSPVGSFEPNKLGLYDMSGNVWEWCWDWYGIYYYEKSQDSTDPEGPEEGIHRTQRGGSWKSTYPYLQCVFRGYFSPDDGDYSIGFRLARNAPHSTPKKNN